MRNLIVVAVLLYLAKKTNTWPLTVIAYASYGAIVLYCLTYTSWWFWDPLHRFEGSRWFIRFFLYQVANIAALASLWFVLLGLKSAVDAVSLAQGN
jgi:hypothetical protein